MINLSSDNITDLVKYRLDRAEEMMEIAQLMIDRNWLSSAINRLYYGCFYAALALFLKNGIDVIKSLLKPEN